MIDLDKPVSATPTVLSVVVATAILFATLGYFAGLGSSLGHSITHRDPTKEGKELSHKQDTGASEGSEDEGAADLNDFSNVTGECKMVLAVRTDLNMGKGKTAAQVGHATLACYKKILKNNPALVRRWESAGQPKICVKVDSEEELEMLQAQALSLGITAAVIHDAGRTQIAAGSATVVGIGPAPKAMVDQVTGHLKLL